MSDILRRLINGAPVITRPKVAATMTEAADTIEELSNILQRFVDEARVGSGNKPVTRSARVNCPAGIYHDAVTAIAKLSA